MRTVLGRGYQSKKITVVRKYLSLWSSDQKFKLEHSSKFKFISKSRAGESYAFCTLCRSDICIAHSGRDDIKKHVGTNIN